MEMEVLHQNGTWEQVAFLPSKKTIGCKWVYTVKFNLDGSVEILKGHSVAKGYTQMYGIDYDETLPKFLMFMWLFSLAANLDWPLFQLDVKKMFFYIETYTMRFIWSNHLGLLLKGSIKTSI